MLVPALGGEDAGVQGRRARRLQAQHVVGHDPLQELSSCTFQAGQGQVLGSRPNQAAAAATAPDL